jgi:dihydroxy-acid dehydratase
VPRTRPRIGVLSAGASDLPDRTREAGGEPVSLILPPGRPCGGVALAREWVADIAQVSCTSEDLDGLLVAAGAPEELAGFLICALRLDLPSVVVPDMLAPFGIVPYALGLSPLREDPVEVAVATAGNGVTRPGELVESFSLANALRAGCALDGGPELLVHLAAVAREAGVPGFSQMIRVLAPETPASTAPTTAWYAEHGAGGLLASLGEAMNDTRTVTGNLKEELPETPPPPKRAGSRLVFVEGRASGVEALCRVEGPEREVSGTCRVFGSDEEAARAVEEGLDEGTLPVVVGCGPRGGPGLVKLELFGEALDAAGLDEVVLTDGLAPGRTAGVQISLLTPEAASGGVIGLLRDGDTLRIDLVEGRIRTNVRAAELEERESYGDPEAAGTGYSARYSRSALPALEGAGFD